MGRIIAYLKACRMEYLPAQLIGISIPFLLSGKFVLTVPIIEALIAFFLLYWSGFLINALEDVEVDKKYKKYVAQAVEELGKNNLKILIIFHVALALTLAFHISIQLSNLWLFIFVVISTFFGLSYSIKPFHFKVRGVLHSTLAFSAMFAPFIFLYYVIAGTPPAPILLILVSLTITHYGIALVNQSQDYMEDKETGLATPAVRWGLAETLILSLLLAVSGLILSLISIGIYLGNWLLIGISLIILVSAYSLPIKGIWRMIKISIGKGEIMDKIAKIKGMLNYPFWQMSGIVGILIVSIIIFVMKI